MSFVQPARHDRVKAAVATALAQALLGYALLFGLIRSAPAQLQATLARFTLTAPAPPPIVEPPPPAPHVSTRKSGAASPPNLRATPTDLVAPKPVIPPPPTLPAAPKAGPGTDSSAGASSIAGPGFGSGGFGDGSRSGGFGDGDGDGGTPPRHMKGGLRDSDYPDAAAETGAGGVVGVRYRVGIDGRVGDCRITRSSGSRELDDTTCRLIVQRYRFEPARDESGRPVASTLVEDEEWVPHPRPSDR